MHQLQPNSRPVPKPLTDDARVTDEELRLLLAPAPTDRNGAYDYTGVDRYFWHRSVFMLAVSIFDTVVLLFLPHEVFRVFELPEGAPALARYLHLEGWVGLLVTVLYGYSYLRDWNFDRIALVSFAIMLTNFGHDFFYIADAIVPIQPVVVVATLARALAILFLLINALNAKRAPPVHRRLWP